MEDLRLGEQVIEEIKGDYGEKFLFMYTRKRDKFVFTNQKIKVYAGFDTVLDLEYKDITDVKKCSVGGNNKMHADGY